MQEPFLFNRDGYIRPRKTFYSAIDWKQKATENNCPTGSVGAQLIQCLSVNGLGMNKDMSRRQKFPRHTLGVVSAEFPKCCNRRRTREKAIKTKHQHRSQPTHVNLHALLRRSGESNYRAISPQTATCSRCLHFFHAERAEKLVHLNYGFNARAFKCVPRLFLCGGFYVTV